MTTRFSTLAALLFAPAVFAADLREAMFTQVIKDVTVVSGGTKSTAKAKLNDRFINPDIIQTGPDSLAELVAADKTVTRIGANTIFSFSGKGRELNLEQGSVLFHSPKGKGGGTVKTKAASASVLGTTIVVTATAGGGFKAIVLEGRGQITLPNGNFRILTAGQVTFVLPGSQRFGPQLNINLSKLVESSRLVQGFEQELPSKPVIQAAIERQVALIVAGVAEDTRILIGNQATEETVATVDSTVIEQAVEVREDRLAIAKRTNLEITPANLMTGVADPGATAAHLFLDRVPFEIPILGSLNFSGVVGRNITIASTVTALDFTSYLNQTDFNIGATEYLYIQSASLQLTATLPVVGMSQLQDVRLAGKFGLTIPSGASINAFHIGNLHLLTGGTMSLNNVSLENSGGQLHLNAGTVLDLTGGAVNRTPSMLLEGATVSLNGGSYNVTGTAHVSAYGTELNTSGFTSISGNIVSLEANTSSDLHDTTASATTLLNLNSQQDVTVAAGSYTVSGAGGTLQTTAGRDIFVGSSAQFQGNTVQMTASRDATLTSPVVRGFTTLNVNAVQNIAVASGSFTGASMSPTIAATFSAGDTLTVNGPTFANVADISLSARTVNLSNIDFQNGSTVRLYSQNGLLAANPNTGAASVPGHVNFILNVNYNGSPAQLFVGGNITIGVRPP
ncbi:MAG: FecR family protein [Limisphaerales bacterium]